ncbi:MAG: hypothetical protein IJX07_01390 [Bacillales bacterium]|nr:hypothetical protein [Bacillales bacterium]
MLNNLLIEVESNRVIRVSLFENCDLEELLDIRDDEEFDSEWMRVYDALNEFEIGDFEKKKIDNIREKSFLKSYNLSGLGDIASCVSDDFEIICKAYLTNYNDMWVNSLIMSYVNGKFPCGRLEKTEYDIKECMKKLCKK